MCTHGLSVFIPLGIYININISLEEISNASSVLGYLKFVLDFGNHFTVKKICKQENCKNVEHRFILSLMT